MLLFFGDYTFAWLIDELLFAKFGFVSFFFKFEVLFVKFVVEPVLLSFFSNLFAVYFFVESVVPLIPELTCDVVLVTLVGVPFVSILLSVIFCLVPTGGNFYVF